MSILEGTWFFKEEKPIQRTEEQRMYESDKKPEPARLAITRPNVPCEATWEVYK